MGYATAFNPSDTPVTVDGAGRQVGGREWAPVSTLEPLVDQALAAGRLVKVTRPKGKADLNPAAEAAFDATEELNKAAGDDDDDDAGPPSKRATPPKRARRARDTEES
jgi:hypothetical protein